MNFGMKNSIILFLFLIPAFLFAQYPTTGNKSRLGWQTTGDGLIWRGAAGDTVNKPNNRNYPYFQLDTVNSVLYRYIQTRGQWQPTSIDVDSLIYATRFWVNSNFFPLQGGTLTGTGGNGFVGFPLQSSPPSTPTTGFSLYAGSTGNNISWMQPDGFFRRLVSPMTGTPRQYQFMARSYTLADSADVAGKLSISDTTSMLLNYPSTVGYGILKSTKTIRADTTSPNGLATRLFAKTLPTSIVAGRIAVSDGSNLVGYGSLTYTSSLLKLTNTTSASTIRVEDSSNANIFSNISPTGFFLSRASDGSIGASGSFYKVGEQVAGISARTNVLLMNDTRAFLQVGSTGVTIERAASFNTQLTASSTSSILDVLSTTQGSRPFPIMSTAQANAITGVQGLFTYENGVGPRWYNGTRKAYIPESTVARFTSTYIPFADGNGQLTQSANMTFNGSIFNLVGSFNATSNGHRFGNLQILTSGSAVVTGQGILVTGPDQTFQLQGTVAGTPADVFSFAAYTGLTGSKTLQNTNALNSFVRIYGGFTTPNAHSTVGAVLAITPNYNVATQTGATIRGIYYNPTLTSMVGVGTHNAWENTSGNMYFGSTSGVVGIRTSPDASYELKLNGDLFVQDSLRLTTTPAHTSITGLLTRDANGWVGLGTIGSGLSYSGGTLSSTGTWLKTELEAGRDVDVIGISSTDFRIRNTRIQFDDKFKIGSDSSFLYDPVAKNLQITGTGEFRGNSGILYLGAYGGSFPDPSAYNTGYIYNTNNRFGIFSGPGFSVGDEILLHATSTRKVSIRAINDTVPGIGISLSKATFIRERLIIAPDSTFKFDPTTDILQLSKMGVGNKEATDLSFSTPVYIPAFAPSGTGQGTILDYRIARDTFIEDVTLFSVGTLLNTCQELTIVSSMTSTAPSNMEIRFPDAAEELRGRKIIVYSKKKDAGSFIPQIKVVGGVSRLYFTTNPAVMGTDPSDQSTLSIDDSTWSDHGTTFEFTCLKIDNTPSYRWVLKQR